jgi:hypothetical protein
MRTQWFAIAVMAMASLVPVSGQTFGDISGEVRDTTGASIPAAQVTVVNVDTNATRTAVSNESGLYSFPALPPGTYTLKVEKAGFKTVTRPSILIQVQQSARVDMELPVGQVSESVEVSASAALLTTENATVGTVVENKRIVELPLNGRNYLQLVSLSPNVSYGFGSAGQAGSRQGGDRANQNISVAGQRSYFNNFTLDGINNTDPNFNSYVIQPSVDALQEFKVQTGIYPAEFGRQATQINVSTKPGTNQYHGTLFEFLRNDKLDAKNYGFGTERVKDPFKWNQYGFTLGGPVWIPKLFNGKDRLFFMGNYEAFRQRRNVIGRFNLPETALRTGNFSGLATPIYDPLTRTVDAEGRISATQFPGNIIPTNRINPISTKFLTFYPTPNLPGSTLGFNHQISQGRPVNKDQFITRLDFVESTNSQWFGRYSWGDENLLNQALYLNGFQVLTNVEQYMGSNVRVLSPTKVNEARFGYTRFFNSAGRELAFSRDVVSEIGVPGLPTGAPVTWGIPSVSITGFSGFGDDSEGPYANDNNSLQFVDNFSWIHGKHSFRFGGEYRRDNFQQDGNQFARGAFQFDPEATGINGATVSTRVGGNAFADFLLGYSKRSEVAVQIARAQFRSNSYAAYFDDVWKVTSRLTVNMGLRYELTPPWLDRTGTLFTVAIPLDVRGGPVADRSLHPYFLRQGSGDPYEGINLRWPAIDVRRNGALGTDRMVRTDKSDFAPRLGITWNPSSKWVIRTGAGIFYSQDTGNPRFDMARNLAGRTRFESIGSTLYTFQNAFSALSGAQAIVTTPYSFANEVNRNTPSTYSYMLNVQYELPGNQVLEVGYMGNQMRHLEALRAVNEATPGPTGSIASRSPFPEFGRIQLVDNGGYGNYNGLSAKLTRRYNAGLTYLIGYTWSKTMDTGSAIRTHDGDTLFPQNSGCRTCEYGLSSFHTAHRLTASTLYDLPFGRGRAHNIENPVANALAGGWQISSIVTYQTGFPITMQYGRDQSNTGAGFDRPNATGISPKRDNPTTEQFFNTLAFELQPFGSYGNVGRNTLIGPGIFRLDASMLKNFNFTESTYLQFRFEAFNATNHPNWGNPNNNIFDDRRYGGNGNFGRITSTRGDMRDLQLALKFVF